MTRRSTCRQSAFWGIVLGLLLVTGPAFGDESSRYRDQITQYNAQLVELQSRDGAAALNREFSDAKTWLADALVQVGKENFDQVKFFIRRADVTLDFVEAELNMNDAIAAAAKAQDDLSEAKTRAHELSEQAQKLRDAEAKAQEALKKTQGAK